MATQFLVKVKSNLRISIYWFYGQKFIQLPIFTNSMSACCFRRISTLLFRCQRLIQDPCIIWDGYFCDSSRWLATIGCCDKEPLLENWGGPGSASSCVCLFRRNYGYSLYSHVKGNCVISATIHIRSCFGWQEKMSSLLASFKSKGGILCGESYTSRSGTIWEYFWLDFWFYFLSFWTVSHGWPFYRSVSLVSF